MASIDRILTDEDFKRIDTAQIRKQISTLPRGVKRSLEESESRFVEINKNIRIMQRKILFKIEICPN